MASKKDAADKAEEKKAPAKKTTTKKTTKPKASEKKAAPEQPKVEEIEVEKVGEDETGYDPKILKSADVELPKDEPAGKQTIVVSHEKSAKADESINVITADEVLKDLEYDFDEHEIKPFKGEAMTSHEMHQGKYGIIEDVTKPKKRK